MNKNTPQIDKITIVIPTLNREEILLNTISSLIQLSVTVENIIVVDQTLIHSSKTYEQLSKWNQANIIAWHTLLHPSVVSAMNVGLKREARTEYVLFLDDDIKPRDVLIESYNDYINNNKVNIVAGRVIEPWDEVEGVRLKSDEKFSFNSLDDCFIDVFMGGNFLVNREFALSLGGFDENFVGTAHDYEREFSDRVILSGGLIAFCASAAVHHLKEKSGGIRTYGHFLKTIKPHHAVGAYYYILRSNLIEKKSLRILSRLKQRVITKTHLRQPWWIPITLIGDFLGLSWAIILYISGPKLINVDKQDPTYSS